MKWLLAICGAAAVLTVSIAVGLAVKTEVFPRGNRTPAVMSRDEFRTAVMGKAPEEVVRAMGRPYATRETTDARDGTYWYYKERTFDPVSGRVDFLVALRFRYDRVDLIDF